MDKEIEEFVPENLKVAFKKIEALDLSKFTSEDREKYDESIKVYRDNLVTYAGAIEKGKREQNLENAKSMKLLGLATNVIMQVTGLSEEEIKKL